MDHHLATEPPGSSALLAMNELAKSHRDHARYYASAPHERAAVLRQHADSLRALADQWSLPGTPPSLSTLRRSLWLIADEAAGNGAWLDAAMESSWDEAASLIELDEFADVLEVRHRIIANDWQAALLDGLAAKLLRRALDILESVDAIPTARRDPTSITASANRLRGAAAIIARAAELLDDAAALGAENERHWSVVRGRIRELAVTEDGP